MIKQSCLHPNQYKIIDPKWRKRKNKLSQIKFRVNMSFQWISKRELIDMQALSTNKMLKRKKTLLRYLGATSQFKLVNRLTNRFIQQKDTDDRRIYLPKSNQERIKSLTLNTIFQRHSQPTHSFWLQMQRKQECCQILITFQFKGCDLVSDQYFQTMALRHFRY